MNWIKWEEFIWFGKWWVSFREITAPTRLKRHTTKERWKATHKWNISDDKLLTCIRLTFPHHRPRIYLQTFSQNIQKSTFWTGFRTFTSNSGDLNFFQKACFSADCKLSLVYIEEDVKIDAPVSRGELLSFHYFHYFYNCNNITLSVNARSPAHYIEFFFIKMIETARPSGRGLKSLS